MKQAATVTVFSFLFLILLSPALALAQACLTGADQEPCDGEVNITELMNHINAWYLCSSCVPDMFQSIQAYYGIPFCGDGNCSAGENCPEDNMSCTDNACYEPTCANGCAEAPVPAYGNDEACSLPNFCDGSGNCVECVDDDDCLGGGICQSGQCVFPDCTGITECSDYTDSVNCTNDPCNVSGNCKWNGTDCAELAAASFDGWRVLPIRSEEEYDLGMIGGEGEQDMLGFARSLSNPDIIYANQDVAGPWKSIDGGESWRKLIAKGLHVDYSYSIEVDPFNPDIVFTIVCSMWDSGENDEFEGLYRSIDGGDNWEHVLPIVMDAQTPSYQAERKHQHNIAYDFSSIDGSGAKIWYAAFLNKGLYKSANYGDAGSWVKVADLTAQGAIYEIEVNPGDGSVYIGTAQGLSKYTQSGGLQPLGDLPTGIIPSIEINLQDSNIIFVTLQSETITGLYKSIDKGNTFNLLKTKVATGLLHAFINPGYPDTIYLLGAMDWPQYATIITHDGGQTWIEHNSEFTVYRFPGVTETGYHYWLSGGKTGAVVPNSQNENEAVGYFNGQFYKTSDGGHSWLRSSTLFTGYAVWTNSGFAFDKFDPKRFALFLCDVIMVITKTGGDWFYHLTKTTEGGDIREEWRSQRLIPAWGATGSYSGTLQPIAGSESMVATIGDYPVGAERVRVMYLENESTGWDLASHIKLIEAEHLDENKNFVSDIYSEVKTIDDIFSETIPIGHYVRTTFDQNLTKYHRISIFLDKASPTTIEVYANGNLVTAFVCSVGGCQVTLSDLAQEVNVLDFKMVGEDIKFDCIRESKLYNIKFVAFHQNDPNIVYAGDLKSYDGGKSFKIIEFKNEIEGAPSYTGAKIFSMCQSNPDVVYAIYHYSKGILRSDDAGETWRKYHLGSWRFDKSSIHFPTFAVDPVDCNIVYTIDSSGDIAVYNGSEWRSLGLLPLVERPENMDISVGTLAIDPRNNSIIYASIGGGSGISSIWRSTDKGQTWEDISYNLPRKGYPIVVNPHTGELFAGGAVGTWIFPPPYNSSNLVYNKAYPMPSCYDGLQNGDETGVDSGGSCA